MEEKSFIKDLIKDIKTIDTSNLTDINSLENVIDLFTKAIKKKLKNYQHLQALKELVEYKLL